MKITKLKLKQIIKEELQTFLQEQPEPYAGGGYKSIGAVPKRIDVPPTPTGPDPVPVDIQPVIQRMGLELRDAGMVPEKVAPVLETLRSVVEEFLQKYIDYSRNQ